MPGTWLHPEVTKVNKKEAVLEWAQHWEGRGHPCPGPQKKWCLSLGSREWVTGEGQTHTWSTVSKEHRPWGKTQACITQSHCVQRASSLAICWLYCPCPLHDFAWVSFSSASSFPWMLRSLQVTVLSVGCFCWTLTPQEAKYTLFNKATQTTASQLQHAKPPATLCDSQA